MADQLGVPVEGLLDQARTGAIPAFQIGKRWRFDPVAVQNAIFREQQRQKRRERLDIVGPVREPETLRGWPRSASSRVEGFVYFLKAERAGVVKIGQSTVWSGKRLVELDRYSPVPLRLVAVAVGGEAAEGEIHIRLAAHRIRYEWFDASAKDVKAEIARCRDLFGRPGKRLGLPRKFVETYRVTVAAELEESAA